MTSPYEHPQLQELSAEYERVRADMERLGKLRDQLIREELAKGWRPSDLARATGLSRSRIDQIKNQKGK